MTFGDDGDSETWMARDGPYDKGCRSVRERTENEYRTESEGRGVSGRDWGASSRQVEGAGEQKGGPTEVSCTPVPIPRRRVTNRMTGGGDYS